MNEALKAESNKALALQVGPSDPVTCAWLIMINSDCWLIGCDTSMVTASVCFSEESLAKTVLHPPSCAQNVDINGVTLDIFYTWESRDIPSWNVPASNSWYTNCSPSQYSAYAVERSLGRHSTRTNGASPVCRPCNYYYHCSHWRHKKVSTNSFDLLYYLAISAHHT